MTESTEREIAVPALADQGTSVIIFDADKRVVTYSGASDHCLVTNGLTAPGTPLEAVLGMLREANGPGEVPDGREVAGQVTESAFAFECASPEGRTMDCSLHSLADRGWALVMTDVTRDRRRVRLYEEAQRLARAGVCEFDMATGEIRASEALWSVFGEGSRAAMSTFEGWEAHTHPEDRERTKAIVEAGLARNEGFDIEYRIVPPNGRTMHVVAKGAALLNEQGQVEGGIGVILDITDRKLAEERIRALVENALDIIAVLDEDGTIRLGSPSAEAVTGLAGEELMGRNFAELLHPDDARDAMAALRRIAQIPGKTGTAQVRCRHADGSWRTLETIARNLSHVPAIGGILVNSRDITDQIQAENRLRQAQKMEAVGQLAGGVAHDFNNLLTGILGNAALLGNELADQPELNALTGEISAAGRRAAELTTQLLAFSRRSTGRRQSVDMHAIINEVSALLSRSLDRRIVIRHTLAAERSVVIGDPTQLQTAILNLAVNARDAMPDGGRLTFATRNRHIEEGNEHELAHSLIPGPYLEVSVSDTGVGVAEEIKERIFEPYFTLKPTGEGTGLGLAAVEGATRAHGGFTTMQSAVGEGSTFRLTLPAATGEPLAADAVAQALVVGSGHILVIEDEDTVRNYALRALHRLGYELTACSDGAEAIELVRAGLEEIDAVLLDLNMPQRSGAEVFQIIREVAPDMPIVVCSGFDAEGEIQQLLRTGNTRFLGKPFVTEELSEAIAGALVSDSPENG